MAVSDGSRDKTYIELLNTKSTAELAVPTPEEIAKAKPKTWIESGGKTKSLFGDKKRDRETLKKYKNMYEQGGGVSTGLDLYPLFILANGYRLEGDTNGEQLQWWNAIEGDKILWQAVSDAINLGDAFQELVGTRGNGGDIITIMPRNPIDFEINYDDKGIIKDYTQVQDENTGTGIKLKPDQILHLVLLPQSGSHYGMAMIKRAYDDIIRDTKVADASTTAMFRHGFKKYHIKVGREAELIPDTVISDISKQFEDIETKNEFTTCHDIEIKNIDEGGLEKVKEYNEISLMRVCSAIGVPSELIGLRQGTTDNTAVVRVKAFFKKIQTFQKFVAQCFNVNVFDRRTGKPGSVRLVMNDPDPSDEVEVAGWISKIMMSSPQQPFQVLPVEWIQKKFNIETGDLINTTNPPNPATVPGQKERVPPTTPPKEPPGVQQPIA